jgi:signal transduction histidine kinase
LEKAVSKDQTYYTFITKSNYHIQRLEKLIADLLDITKIQSGSIQLDMSTYDMNDLLTECISGMQTINYTHEIQFIRTAPVKITGDYFRIEQVIINLVNNAIKYSPTADIVEVSLSAVSGEAKIEIKDYGIGIDKKHISKVFDRFYRVGEISHHFQGLGLGLYISAGTTLWFTLPQTV